MNEAVQKWRLVGNVYVWRYKGHTRNYEGWHMTADRAACTSLLELLALMTSSDYSAKVRVELTMPGPMQLGIPNAALKHRPAKEIQISYAPRKMNADHWHLVESKDALFLEVGRAMLCELRRGITDVSRNQGDYCIGPDGEELWFWPGCED
ncbi:MAG TPA: hypothetical protein VG711_11615 [Phycisphaerales bacterium]|nr:hypothetical protein [Phycisphaerales bacterium]